MEIADRVTVLRDGKVTGELEAGATNVEELSKLMVGRELLPTTKSDVKLGETVLQVKDVSIMGAKANPCWIRSASRSKQERSLVSQVYQGTVNLNLFKPFLDSN